MMPDTDAGFVDAELGELQPPDTPPEPDKAKRKRRPGRPRKGVCRECGEPAATRDATYCADHQPVRQDRKPRARTSSGATAKLETELRTNLEMLAMVWQATDPVCGGALANQAPQIAAFWAARAKENATVARVVESVAGGGGLVGGVLAHMPVLFAVYAHHVVEPRQRRAAEAAEAANVPVGAVQNHPDTGQPFVHRGNGEWSPATPDDLAAAGLLGDTPSHGESGPETG